MKQATVDPAKRKKLGPTAVLFTLILVGLLLSAACTGPAQHAPLENPSPAAVPTTTGSSLFFSGVKIPQPESVHPDYIRMDSDVFLQGEMIRFHIVNLGSSPLACDWLPPYIVYRQTGTWEPVTKSTGNYQLPGNYWLGTDNSTPEERVTTDDLDPGRYKIVKCRVSREFEIHTARTISHTLCPEQVNTTPFIGINPIGEHPFKESFEINGTTNLGTDKKIKIDVSVGPFSLPYGTSPMDRRAANGYVTIVPQDCGNQKWSYVLNGSDEHFAGFSYDVSVESENGEVKNRTQFHVRNDFDSPVTQ